MLICSKCGNTTDFHATLEKKQYYDVIVDPETGDYDTQNEEFQQDGDDEVFDTTCTECDSEEVEDFDTKQDLLEFKLAHTDREDKWHEEELPEDERSEKVKSELAMHNIVGDTE